MSATPFSGTPSSTAQAILRSLRHRHNVLVSGPPATGKSRVLQEVRYWFLQAPNPGFDPKGPVAFPAGGAVLKDLLPSPERKDRRVFPITFHQGTKYRDFVSGAVPIAQPDKIGFRTNFGPFFQAIRHAASADGASLVIIDEINRGPAVAVFGDTLTAIESDKRLAPDGKLTPLSWTVSVQNEKGEPEELAIPHHLYILAAMNQADTSVEPLDVAFLRRFQHHWLGPDEALLRQHLGRTAAMGDLPNPPASADDVLEALIRAWSALNRALSLARGPEFQIGHGVAMSATRTSVAADVNKALAFASDVWARLYAHASEVFFGDSRSLAAALRADTEGNPYHLETAEFAEVPVVRLSGPSSLPPEAVYPLLRSMSIPRQ
ncbi:MAG: AAA family ATPase [Phycisphaeraceae bacterium]|nr:AAA family ATPase [Phycisphaeraceae bacterium]MCW5769652.1 AAA family ATPase [Phycisphaeraceae bacterium]